MCVTFVTCEVRVCGPRCHSGSSLYIPCVLVRFAGMRVETRHVDERAQYDDSIRNSHTHTHTQPH